MLNFNERKKLHHNHPAYKTDFFKYLGLPKLFVYSNIFRPEISSITISLAEYLKRYPKLYYKKSVLDIGCGCGIFAILTAKYAKKVVAVDILNKAILNTKRNAFFYGFENIDARKGNLFDSINKKEKFDLIVFNLPFFIADDKHSADQYLFTDEISLKKLWGSIPHYLTKIGIAITAYLESRHSLKFLNPLVESKKTGLRGRLIDTTPKIIIIEKQQQTI